MQRRIRKGYVVSFSTFGIGRKTVNSGTEINEIYLLINGIQEIERVPFITNT